MDNRATIYPFSRATPSPTPSDDPLFNNPDIHQQQPPSLDSAASRQAATSSHRSSPTGTRFQCPKCPKNFSRVENLTRHQANHDDIGKFVCPFCGKRFTRSDLLNRHKRIHPKDDNPVEKGISKSHVTQVRFAPQSPSPSRPLQRERAGQREHAAAPGRKSASTLAFSSTVSAGSSSQTPIPRHVRPPNPVLVAFQNALPNLQFPAGLPPGPQNHGLDSLMEAALGASVPIVPQKRPPSNLSQDGTFLGSVGKSAADAYLGTHDADISWALDSFNADSTSNYSSDYEMMNAFEVPSSQFDFVQYPSMQESQLENPIDAADNEDEDTNDWPDNVDRLTHLPRRTPRIVPLRLIPTSWQPLIEEARNMKAGCPLPNLQSIDEHLRHLLLESLNGDPYDESTPKISDAMFPPAEALELFLNLYFQHIQPRFPVVHLPTFDLHLCSPLLLVAMMLLGSSHSAVDRGRFSRLYHSSLRVACVKLHSHDPKYLRTLDNILTYFLLCLGGTWSGSKESYEFAEGARGILVTACRRLRLLDCRPAPLDIKRFQDSGLGLTVAKWLAWIEVEKGKRLALSVYVYDCQYPGLFNVQHFVSKAETTNLTFPCEDEFWAAPTANVWRSLLGPLEVPKPEYCLQALNCCLLHRYIKPAPPVIRTGEFGKTLLLYAIHTHIFDWRQATCMLAPTGLMSVTAPWDMGNPLRERRIWLLDGLHSWAECYQDAETSTAARLLHLLGYVSIDINLSDMHLVAGRSNNLNDGSFAERNLALWANSETAPSTMAHIYQMLQICHQHIQNGFAAESSYEVAVCLFTGGIVCWAFARLNEPVTMERERCLEEVRKASKALKVMGCWRMCAMFGRILSGFEGTTRP